MPVRALTFKGRTAAQRCLLPALGGHNSQLNDQLALQYLVSKYTSESIHARVKEAKKGTQASSACVKDKDSNVVEGWVH